ncbi:MAG: LamG domain-containing protein [Cytophagaceae bacterium]|nr:LamG domain-containing protein [Cytophagaceae bacterium]
MKRQLTGIRWAKTYGWIIGLLLLLLGCKWELPRKQDPLTKGLVAYYPFNESTLDVSGNNLNGQLINGATYGPGKSGKPATALLLDGKDDYFEIRDDAKLRPEVISISLWLKIVRGDTTTIHIYNKSNYLGHTNQQYSAFIRPKYITGKPNGPGNDIFADVNQDGSCEYEKPPLDHAVVYYDPAFQLNRWYHFVSVFEGTTGKLYIDGELKGSDTALPPTPIDRCVGGNLRFGTQADVDTNPLNGSVDEIRIYNRALTATEIKVLSKQWE